MSDNVDGSGTTEGPDRVYCESVGVDESMFANSTESKPDGSVVATGTKVLASRMEKLNVSGTPPVLNSVAADRSLHRCTFGDWVMEVRYCRN